MMKNQLFEYTGVKGGDKKHPENTREVRDRE